MSCEGFQTVSLCDPKIGCEIKLRVKLKFLFISQLALISLWLSQFLSIYVLFAQFTFFRILFTWFALNNSLQVFQTSRKMLFFLWVVSYLSRFYGPNKHYIVKNPWNNLCFPLNIETFPIEQFPWYSRIYFGIHSVPLSN